MVTVHLTLWFCLANSQEAYDDDQFDDDEMTPDVTNTTKQQTTTNLTKGNNGDALEIEGDFDEDEEEGDDTKPN